MSVMRVVAVLGVLAVVSGCRSTSHGCAKPREYTSSDSVPALKVPEGLEAPDTRTSLRIPELATPERTRGPEEPCIDEPPSFSAPRAMPKGAPAQPAPAPAPAPKPEG